MKNFNTKELWYSLIGCFESGDPDFVTKHDDMYKVQNMNIIKEIEFSYLGNEEYELVVNVAGVNGYYSKYKISHMQLWKTINKAKQLLVQVEKNDRDLAKKRLQTTFHKDTHMVQ